MSKTKVDTCRETQLAAIGYQAPADGIADRGGSYTLWVQISPPDGLYYSAKDLTEGLMDRYPKTAEHIRVLKARYPMLRIFDTKAGKFRE